MKKRLGLGGLLTGTRPLDPLQKPVEDIRGRIEALERVKAIHASTEPALRWLRDTFERLKDDAAGLAEIETMNEQISGVVADFLAATEAASPSVVENAALAFVESDGASDHQERAAQCEAAARLLTLIEQKVLSNSHTDAIAQVQGVGRDRLAKLVVAETASVLRQWAEAMPTMRLEDAEGGEIGTVGKDTTAAVRRKAAEAGMAPEAYVKDVLARNAMLRRPSHQGLPHGLLADLKRLARPVADGCARLAIAFVLGDPELMRGALEESGGFPSTLYDTKADLDTFRMAAVDYVRRGGAVATGEAIVILDRYINAREALLAGTIGALFAGLKRTYRALSDMTEREFVGIVTDTEIGLIAQDMLDKARENQSKTSMRDLMFGAESMQLAVALWGLTYKLSENEAAHLQAIEKHLAPALKSIHDHDAEAKENGAECPTCLHANRTGLFLARWAHFAFPRLVTSHTFAAALMCTTVTEDVLSDLEIQWLAFEVHVPTDILVHEGVDYDRIRVLVTENGEAELSLFSGKHPGNVTWASEDSLTKLLSAPAKDDRVRSKLLLLACRLVAGLLLTVQHTDNFKERTVRGRRAIGDKRQPPDHRVVFVGRPISVDARDGVRRFLRGGAGRGKAAPPSVQVLVRGHHKRQVVGLGRAGRKVIWVEPYWRGPEDAPILTRPQKIGSS